MGSQAWVIILRMTMLPFQHVFEFGERPLGAEANRHMAEYLRSEAKRMGYPVKRLPFNCVRWESGPCFAARGEVHVPVFAGPYSPSFEKSRDVVVVSTLRELEKAECEWKILLMHGDLTKDPLMPRDFPFYFPKEHKAIYELLEEKKPKAILAVTGAHPACGLNPYPLFDDANFQIPAAYVGAEVGAQLLAARGMMGLKIDSQTLPETGEQVVIRKKAIGESKGKIIMCAHMDTAYGTPGALDNAAGVAAMLEAMELLKEIKRPLNLEFLPFNGEDSPMVKGQMAYLGHYGNELDQIRLVVNIDAVGCKESNIAVSAYNLEEAKLNWLDAEIAQQDRVERGPAWVEGDHSIFAFRGIPTLAITSSNLREKVMKLSHTPNDTPDLVDPELLKETGDFIAQLVQAYVQP